MDGQETLPRPELPFSLESINFHSSSVQNATLGYLRGFWPLLHFQSSALRGPVRQDSDVSTSSAWASVESPSSYGTPVPCPVCRYFETNPLSLEA